MRRLFVLLVLAIGALYGVSAQPSAQSVTPTAICAPAPPSRLILRERARVSLQDPRPLNMRAGPGTAARVLAQIPASGVFYVLAGPECDQNYAWYRVEYHGISGWVAEGDDQAYYVELYPPG